MKLIIDIDKELAEKGHWYTDEEMWTVIKAAQNGTPIPDNATNGEVIKAMFPNMKIRWETVSRIGITYKNNQDYITEFDLSWWNAPYQKGGKGEVI